jgi:hypothetical protein
MGDTWGSDLLRLIKKVAVILSVAKNLKCQLYNHNKKIGRSVFQSDLCLFIDKLKCQRF